MCMRKGSARAAVAVIASYLNPARASGVGGGCLYALVEQHRHVYRKSCQRDRTEQKQHIVQEKELPWGCIVYLAYVECACVAERHLGGESPRLGVSLVDPSSLLTSSDGTSYASKSMRHTNELLS